MITNNIHIIENNQFDSIHIIIEPWCLVYQLNLGDIITIIQEEHLKGYYYQRFEFNKSKTPEIILYAEGQFNWPSVLINGEEIELL